jgi:hypothetical protein
MRERLEGVLAEGVEARSFARGFSPFLPAADEQLGKVQALLEQIAQAEDAASTSLAEELRLLDQATRAYRDLLAEALSRATAPPRAVDWDRVRAAEEAYARGETKPFSRR